MAMSITVSCHHYFADPKWAGTSGTCLAARASGTNKYIACGIVLGGFGAADCLCVDW